MSNTPAATKLQAIIDFSRYPFSSESAARRVWLVLVVVGVFLLGGRLLMLGADFPADSRFARDGVLYTDEGWYANNAISWARTGDWYNEGDMNFAPSLPIQQIFHGFFFSLFGVSVAAARLASVLGHVASALIAFWLARRYLDKWSAALVLLLMGSNYFFFTYSRLALAENLVQAFLMGSVALLCLADGRRGWLLAAVAGMLFALSVLTKTSGILAAPAIVIVILATRRSWRDRLLTGLLYFGVAGCLIIAHRVWLYTNYKVDAAFFSSINLGMNLDTDRFFAMVRRTFYRIRRIDNALYYLLLVSIVFFAIFSRGIFRRPLVLASGAFIVVYLTAFAVYANIQPRYWAAISAPLALLVAAVARECYDIASRKPRLGLVFPAVVLLIAGSLVDNVVHTVTYFAKAEYSFAEMSRDVKRRMDAEAGVPHVLLGHFSTTIALYEDIRFVNDIYGADPLEYRLRLHRPQWMITEDVYTEDTHRRGPIIRGEPMFGERVAVIDYFYEVEEVARYDVLRNYKEYQIHFYRLHERADVDWEIPADYPTELRENPIPPQRRGDPIDN